MHFQTRTEMFIEHHEEDAGKKMSSCGGKYFQILFSALLQNQKSSEMLLRALLPLHRFVQIGKMKVFTKMSLRVFSQSERKRNT